MRVGAQWRELDSLEAAWLATPEGSQEEADIGAKMDEQLYLIRDTSIGLVVLAESCLGSGSLDGFDVEKAEAGRL